MTTEFYLISPPCFQILTDISIDKFNLFYGLSYDYNIRNRARRESWRYWRVSRKKIAIGALSL